MKKKGTKNVQSSESSRNKGRRMMSIIGIVAIVVIVCYGTFINRKINDKKIDTHDIEKLDIKKFALELKEDEIEYTYESEVRKGKNTKDFYSNKNINFEGEIKKNTEFGKKGEDIVVEYEKTRLIIEGREDLADKVFATRDIAGNAERFDVLSYDKEGNEKYIEVKTTKGGLNNMFHISENEVEFSEQYQDKYYLYRVYNFNIKSMSADLKIIKGAINRDKLQATNYTCRIGGK